MLQFTNPEVAAQFECTEEQDRKVHKAGLFSGMLSDIILEMAEAFVKGGSNLIIRKIEEAGSKKD